MELLGKRLEQAAILAIRVGAKDDLIFLILQAETKAKASVAMAKLRKRTK